MASGEDTMEIVQFLGRVLAPGMSVSVMSPLVGYKLGDQEIEVAMYAKVEASTIVVECRVEKYEPDNLGEMQRRADELARATVNVAAFASGIQLLIVLEKAKDPSGREILINRRVE